MKAQISPQDESLLSDIEVGGLSDGQQEGCDVDQTQTKSPCGRHAVVLSKLHFVCIGICFVVLLVLVVVVGISAAPTLHFSNALGSSMVLSRNSSVIWGYSGTENDVINILLDDRKIGTVHANTQINYSWMNNAYEWKFTMPSFGDDESLGPYTITIESQGSKQSQSIDDVYFGEIFLCSGQSNMQFTVGSEFNATSELDRIRTGEYDLMRFMVAGALQEGSFMDSPSAEFYNISIDWTKPVDKYFNTADCKINDATQWNHGISAVCWDFGRRLYEHFDKKIPIGLVDSAFGGTSMSYWSSPQDVQACSQYDGYFSCEKSKTTTSKVNAGAKPAPFGTCSGLYNGMLFPLRYMVFSGVAWYQGENDVPADGKTEYFECAFSEIIKSTFGSLFDAPFISVQLAPYNNVEHAPEALANVRAVQQQVTSSEQAHTGLVPTLDLGDPDSNCASGDIHPRHKEEIGERITSFFLYFIFKLTSTTLPVAPVPVSCSLNGESITIVFDSELSPDSPSGPTPCHDATMKPMREGGRCVPSGYEVFLDGKWEMISNKLTSTSRTNALAIQINVPGSDIWSSGTKIRYAWSDYPALSLFASFGRRKVPVSQFLVSCTRE